MPAIWTMPNYGNSNVDTQSRGIKHMGPHYASYGRSLAPLQRSGHVAAHDIPVMPAAGSAHIGGNMSGPPSRFMTPPVVAYAGTTSHTNMWQYHM